MFNIINTDAPILFNQVNYISITATDEEYSIKDPEVKVKVIAKATEYLQKCLAETSKTTRVNRIVSVEREYDYENNLIILHCFFEIAGKVMYNENLGINVENGRFSVTENIQEDIQNEEEMKGDNN